ncbi:MAG: hypothetical protein AB1432_04700 [Bacteroidota bacterium]
MRKIENIYIALLANPFFIIFGSLLLVFFTWYIYKYTIPQVKPYLRYLLITIRSFVLVLILFIMFEPQLSIKHSETIQKVNYLFIDNSASLSIKDSTIRIEKLTAFQNEFNRFDNANKRIYLFGINPIALTESTNQKLNFSEPLTNFSKIFDLVKSAKNVSTITIISDGIITDGYEPIYDAEKLGIPVFTIGIGDTSLQRDLLIKDIIYNQNIYAGKPTELEIIIFNSGFEEETIKLSLFEEDKIIQTKAERLSSTGINKIKFDYTPNTDGDKRLRVTATALPDESNTINNSKTFYISILKSKVKVAVVAGSPSSDLSAVLNSISNDKNLDVSKIIQVGPAKFLHGFNLSSIDSADVLLLIDFPRHNTPVDVVNKAFSAVQNNKPFFLQVTSNTDLSKLKRIESHLPFNITDINSESILVQPEIVTENFNSIFSSLSARQNNWLSLPPLTKNNSELIPKTESAVLLKSIVKNIPISSPLMVSRNIGRQRSIALLAEDLWRWQLSNSEKNILFFSYFVNDIIKWLNITDSKKQFTIKSNKKIYSVGEALEFVAELYDQTFTPIGSAEITLNIKKGETSYELLLDKIRDGIFSSNINIRETGDYSFIAAANFDGVSLKSDVGRFSIVSGSIEKLDTRMNTNFLKQLALISGGKYFSIADYDLLDEEINKINSMENRTQNVSTEIQLWSNEWTIALIIFLFAFEWSIRKRLGMI